MTLAAANLLADKRMRLGQGKGADARIGNVDGLKIGGGDDVARHHPARRHWHRKHQDCETLKPRDRTVCGDRVGKELARRAIHPEGRDQLGLFVVAPLEGDAEPAGVGHLGAKALGRLLRNKLFDRHGGRGRGEGCEQSTKQGAPHFT